MADKQCSATQGDKQARNVTQCKQYNLSSVTLQQASKQLYKMHAIQCKQCNTVHAMQGKQCHTMQQGSKQWNTMQYSESSVTQRDKWSGSILQFDDKASSITQCDTTRKQCNTMQRIQCKAMHRTRQGRDRAKVQLIEWHEATNPNTHLPGCCSNAQLCQQEVAIKTTTNSMAFGLGGLWFVQAQCKVGLVSSVVWFSLYWVPT